MERPTPDMDTVGETLLPRILAFIIDAILVGIVTFVVAMVLVASRRFASMASLIGLLITLAYFIYMEAEYGQTLGKKALDLVVVTEAGDHLTYRTSALRNVLRIVDGLFAYLVGLIVILVTDKDQRIGDLVADTVVVKVRKGGAPAEESAPSPNDRMTVDSEGRESSQASPDESADSGESSETSTDASADSGEPSEASTDESSDRQ